MSKPSIIAEWVDTRARSEQVTYCMTRESRDEKYNIFRKAVDKFGNTYWQPVGSVAVSGGAVETLLAVAVESLANRMRGES